MKTLLIILLLFIGANTIQAQEKIIQAKASKSNPITWLPDTTSFNLEIDTFKCVIVYYMEEDKLLRATQGFILYGRTKYRFDSHSYPFLHAILNQWYERFPANITIISYHELWEDSYYKVLSDKHMY